MDRILVITVQHQLGEGIVHLLRSTNCCYAVEFSSTLPQLLGTVNLADFQAILLAEPTNGLPILSTVHRIRSLHKQARIIVLRRRDSLASLPHLCRLGVCSVLQFDCSFPELRHAVDATLKGQSYMSAAVMQSLAAELYDGDHLHTKLSYREFEIFSLLIRGYSIEETARLFSISKKSVSVYKSSIRRCLRMKNLSDMVLYAFKHGLLVDQEPEITALPGQDGALRPNTSSECCIEIKHHSLVTRQDIE